jgi:hypothetical protein
VILAPLLTLDPLFNLELPQFLRLVSASERQRFLALETDQQRSRRVIEQEKQRWANQQGQQVRVSQQNEGK